MNNLLKKFRSAFLIFGIIATIIFPKVSYAYPVFAQNAYENPREATGRIVCANCHLAAKPTEVEVPQAVLPDTVFEAVVSVPYDTSVKQIQGDGKIQRTGCDSPPKCSLTVSSLNFIKYNMFSVMPVFLVSIYSYTSRW